MVDDSDSLKKNRYGTINDNDSDTVSQQRLDTADASANFVLTGLHACGDLTPTMIRVDDKSDVDQEVAGYPMSNFVKMLPGHQLTYEAREMACHFIDCYHDRLKWLLGSVKIYTFRYASMALKRLKLSEDLTPEQLVIANSRLKQWNHVVAFYTLRLSLAPLVEMVLLLDRALYLAENGIRCKVLPVFDPKLSPRNFVLLARK
ncbi:hypothetical protein LSH36_1255g00023 [Paralvinella palmiformis]|uniref:Uncharacterized protein n=1 Tax=Paralvinella palmiformis TaxID=53620 RepID=A0AAD9IV08_9ANNE|nr:hypothetical protein LSH36_1255g00023 [Paralvinella palmiformis]